MHSVRYFPCRRQTLSLFKLGARGDPLRSLRTDGSQRQLRHGYGRYHEINGYRRRMRALQHQVPSWPAYAAYPNDDIEIKAIQAHFIQS
jgi:hypothetical protein